MGVFTDRTGEKGFSDRYGMGMTVVAYRNANDLDIRFDDGVISEHRSYKNFKLGKISKPKEFEPEHIYSGGVIGRRRQAVCGMMMEVIAVADSGKIVDVRFDDGTVVKNKRLANFMRGQVGHPGIDVQRMEFDRVVESRVGMKKLNSSGYEMEIIAYRGVHDVDVRFRDGSVVTTRMNQFNQGHVKEPNSVHIGEESRATNGQVMRILCYRSCVDVDVEFEDGTIVRHKSFVNFKSGLIKNPNKIYHPGIRLDHLGERFVSNSGVGFVITAYRSAKDLDILTDQGVVRKGLSYYRVCNGEVDCTDYSSRVGEKLLMNCGLYATCESYHDSSMSGATFRFEDGSVRDYAYTHFLIGDMSHPCLCSNGVKRPFVFNGFLVKKLAYRYNDICNYFVVRPDGCQDIVSFDEIRKGGSNDACK